MIMIIGDIPHTADLSLCFYHLKFLGLVAHRWAEAHQISHWYSRNIPQILGSVRKSSLGLVLNPNRKHLVVFQQGCPSLSLYFVFRYSHGTNGNPRVCKNNIIDFGTYVNLSYSNSFWKRHFILFELLLDELFMCAHLGFDLSSHGHWMILP